MYFGSGVCILSVTCSLILEDVSWLRSNALYLESVSWLWPVALFWKMYPDSGAMLWFFICPLTVICSLILKDVSWHWSNAVVLESKSWLYL